MLRYIGKSKLLEAAKQPQYIDNVREPLLALVEAGYRLSPQLQERLLIMAGEK